MHQHLLLCLLTFKYCPQIICPTHPRFKRTIFQNKLWKLWLCLSQTSLNSLTFLLLLLFKSSRSVSTHTDVVDGFNISEMIVNLHHKVLTLLVEAGAKHSLKTIWRVLERVNRDFFIKLKSVCIWIITVRVCIINYYCIDYHPLRKRYVVLIWNEERSLSDCDTDV